MMSYHNYIAVASNLDPLLHQESDGQLVSIVDDNEEQRIIASGFAETNRVKAVQRLGAGQFVKKPYTIESVGLALKKELDRWATGLNVLNPDLEHHVAPGAVGFGFAHVF